MQQAAALKTSSPPPATSRVPLRMVLFILVIVALIGYPVYVFVESAVTGGIRDRGAYKEVDLKAMSLFHFDKVTGTIDDVPQKWRALDGQKVQVVGEMWEPYSAGNQVVGFQLVYSIAKCCFNGPPQIQHFVQARVVPGRAVGYYTGPVQVTGTLHVKVTRDTTTGEVNGVYHLEVEDAQPVS